VRRSNGLAAATRTTISAGEVSAAETFFGSTRGGGKTDGVLGKWLNKFS